MAGIREDCASEAEVTYKWRKLEIEVSAHTNALQELKRALESGVCHCKPQTFRLLSLSSHKLWAQLQSASSWLDPFANSSNFYLLPVEGAPSYRVISLSNKFQKIEGVKTRHRQEFHFPHHLAPFQLFDTLYASGGKCDLELKFKSSTLASLSALDRRGYVTPLKDMATPRHSHSLTGSVHYFYLLASCGVQQSTLLNQVEMYSVLQNGWTELPRCKVARVEHASIVMSGAARLQTFFLFGGKRNYEKAISDATNHIERLSLGQTRWQEVPVRGGVANFSQKMAFLISENTVVLFGGRDNVGHLKLVLERGGACFARLDYPIEVVSKQQNEPEPGEKYTALEAQVHAVSRNQKVYVFGYVGEHRSLLQWRAGGGGAAGNRWKQREVYYN